MENLYKDIYLQRIQDAEHAVEKMTGFEDHKYCYMALMLSDKKKLTAAQDVLEKISQEAPDHFCFILLEAKSLLAFLRRDFRQAKDMAFMALETNPNTLFAHAILARLAIYEAHYDDAIQHYEKVLVALPESEVTLMNMVEALYLNKEINRARQYLPKSRQGLSMRWRLYKILLSLSSWKIRTIWIFLILLTYMNINVSILTFILSTMFIAFVFFTWGVRKGDALVIRRLIYVQMVHVFFFLFPLLSYLENILIN
jgi:tetratricopeptide (TPR) repeat protein